MLDGLHIILCFLLIFRSLFNRFQAYFHCRCTQQCMIGLTCMFCSCFSYVGEERIKRDFVYYCELDSDFHLLVDISLGRGDKLAQPAILAAIPGGKACRNVPETGAFLRRSLRTLNFVRKEMPWEGLSWRNKGLGWPPKIEDHHPRNGNLMAKFGKRYGT